MPEPKLPPKTIHEPDPPKDATNKSSKHPDQASKHMSAIPASVPAKNEKAPCHHQITCQIEKTRWDKAKPFAEIAGIILLAVYTGYTIKIYRASNEAADAAKKSAEVADNTLRMGYRPWVNAESADLVQPLVYPPSQRFYLKLNFSLKNTGTSVATDGVVMSEAIPDQTDVMLKRSEEPCDWLERSKVPVDKNMLPRATGFVLAPGNVLPFPVGMGSDDISSKQVEDGKFFVIGCIIYRDQFKAWHHTKFCFHPVGPTAGPKRIVFMICDFNQDAD